MNTNILIKLVSGFALVFIINLAAIVNPVKAQKLENKYYYDYKDTPLIPIQLICKADASGKNLEPYVKHFFSYDNENQMTQKVTHYWNKDSKIWKPMDFWQIKYETATITVDYAAWDKK